VDRELTLWESRIIMEYLDERFPHPPLMPVYPVARGESRLYMHRIEKDWYTLMNVIVTWFNPLKPMRRASSCAKSCRPSRRSLVRSPTSSAMSSAWSTAIWHRCCGVLPQLGIELSGAGAKELKGYMTRVFERDSFLASLTEAEREMRLRAEVNQFMDIVAALPAPSRTCCARSMTGCWTTS
jgi:RNA polymerase-associated protein